MLICEFSPPSSHSNYFHNCWKPRYPKKSQAVKISLEKYDTEIQNKNLVYFVSQRLTFSVSIQLFQWFKSHTSLSLDGLSDLQDTE